MNFLPGVISSLFLASGLMAQTSHPLGFNAGIDTSYIDRLGANSVAADLLNHFDDRDYLDWMLNPADPTGLTFSHAGVYFILQDQVASTPETYTCVAYNEAPLQLNFPDTAAAWYRTGSINYPPMPVGFTPTSPIAWGITVTFAVLPAPKGDKFIGLGLPQPATGAWPTDGLSPHCTFDLNITNTGTNALDRVGPGITSMSAGNLSCNVPTITNVPSGPAVYPAGTTGLRRQIRLEILANCTGGVAVTQTVQTRYPSSNVSLANTQVPQGGTTNFLSGLNPDLSDANLSTPPRADNIGILITDPNYPNSAVFIMTAIFASPIGSLPLASLAAGTITSNSTGNVCIDFTTASVSLNFTNSTGVCQQMMTFPPAVRTLLARWRPLEMFYQGFILNSANTTGIELHGTGCVNQHL